jgi:hypothetical protein
VRILSGSIEGDANGNVSASGYLAQTRENGETNTIGQAEYKRGVFQDGDSWWAGEKAGVAGARQETDYQKKYGLPDWMVLKGDAAAGTAGAEASISDQGLNVGAGANVGEASLTFGTQGTGDRDETLRAGVSEGVGLAGRVHWGDADKDGNPEYGVGADVGPVSFDLKTEDPLRKAIDLGVGPIAGAATELYDGNMTNDALNAAEEAGRTIGGLFE